MRPLLKSLLFLGLLTACQSNPINVFVPDSQFPLASIPTAGFVIFSAQPLTFERPPISALFVLEGQATYQQTNLSLEVYGAAFQPGGSGCVAAGNNIICDPNPNVSGGRITKLSTAPINFSSAATQPFTLSGAVLNQAINQGQVWLGISITTSLLSSGDVFLRQMVAKVSVLP